MRNADPIDHEKFRRLMIVQRLERMPPQRRQKWLGYLMMSATMGLIAAATGIVALLVVLFF
jgi:hypothetical protein